MAGDLNALTLAHDFMRRHVREGDFCIDATAGRGRDAAFLCSLVGQSGRVLAFDIQQEALDSTRLLLEQGGFFPRAKLIHASHSDMADYAPPESVKCITFNFGWLPGGNHGIFTKPETSVAAIRAGLGLLAPGGVMSLCLYYGRDCGFEERDALLAFLPTIDSARFTVLITSFANRANNPPIPAFIIRDV